MTRLQRLSGGDRSRSTPTGPAIRPRGAMGNMAGQTLPFPSPRGEQELPVAGTAVPSRSHANCSRVTLRGVALLVLMNLVGTAIPIEHSRLSAQTLSTTVEALIDRGRLEEAWTELRVRIDEQGPTARNLLLRGMIHYRRDQYDNALADLKRSFSLDEQNADTSKALGLCLVRMGREDLAETFFKIAVTLAPRDPMAHYYVGLNAYTAKRFDQAVESFRTSVELQPESADGHSFLGRSYEALGDTDAAVTQYRRAIVLNRLGPQRTVHPPLLLGSLLFRQAAFREAEALLREALRYDDESGLAHYWMGLVLEGRSQYAAAAKELTRAAELSPRDHRPHYALARVHRKTGNPDSAAQALERFRALRARSEVETFRPAGEPFPDQSSSLRPKQYSVEE